MSKASALDCITLSYRLSELPTAQHKAGLAGLVLQVQHMQKQEIPEEEVPELHDVTTDSVSITLTEKSCQRLFDELYTAKIVETKVKSKWPGAKPLREEVEEKDDPKTGKKKKSKLFVYNVVNPINPFLTTYLDNELWQKLWRDMLFQIPRAKPTTRRPFNERANDEPCSEGGKFWKEMIKWEKQLKKGKFRTISVSSALLLGAQDINAEQVPFEDRVDQILLLHFWPLTSLIYVPWLLDVNYSDPKRSDDQPVGYSLAIPEICDLEMFCEEFPDLLQNLGDQKEMKKFRPKAACIELPAQSALEFLSNLAALVNKKLGYEHGIIRGLFNAVEYQHLLKLGNNVKSLGSGRITPNRNLLIKYQQIQETYKNPVFRASLLKALLDPAEPQWYAYFAELFEQFPHEFFIRIGNQTPPLMRNFPADVNRKFKALKSNLPNPSKEKTTMTKEPNSEDHLALIVLRMVRDYVRLKAEDRCGIPWDSFKDKKIQDEKTKKVWIDVPKPFKEEQEHVAEKTFLEVRSRHGDEFADYFAFCFGSVKQRINKDEDFLAITQAILTKPDQVRILTLLALSANS
ncbi:Type I-MYXAN CRISPR-associated protein Cmx8 [Planctomycetales bacterium 10988]|nr:Type I-MYXAN CRISPR-associated protein Cmx8 [Planctomycetales bacterium 10988]